MESERCHRIFVSTTSTLCIAETRVFTDLEVSHKGSPILAGTGHNIRYGERTTLSAKLRKTTSNKPRPRSKSNSSTELKESSVVSNSKDLPSKRRFAERSNEMSLKEDYERAFKAACDWEMELPERYDEEKELSIISMLGYLDNIENGFGHRNDERLYRDERAADRTGKLFEEANRGLALSLESRRLQGELSKRQRISNNCH